MPKNGKRKGFGIPNPEPKSRSGSIPEPDGPSGHLTFSFRHAALNCQKFRLSDKETGYFLKLLERFKALSGESSQYLKSSRSDALKCHPIFWHDTSEKRGFSHLLPVSLADSVPYQFSISKNKWGRVHGFFIGNIFYIVWFDPEHLLYPGKK